MPRSLPELLREHATNLMEAFLSADARQCKQSGTEEQIKEKEQLLEILCEKFTKRSLAKQAAAAARKEKVDKD